MATWDGLTKQEFLPITEIEKVQSDERARTGFTKGGNLYPLLRSAGQAITQDKVSILPPQKIAEAFILLQTSLDDKHY